MDQNVRGERSNLDQLSKYWCVFFQQIDMFCEIFCFFFRKQLSLPELILKPTRLKLQLSMTNRSR